MVEKSLVSTAGLLYGRSSTVWHRRVQSILAAFVMILLIGFSRVYFGAHYLSDVLAACAAGLAWLAFSLTAVDTLRRSRNREGGISECGSNDWKTDA